MFRYETDKTAHFRLSAVSSFVALRRHLLPPLPPLADSSSALTREEVSFCAEILSFARNHFNKNLNNCEAIET